MPRTRNPYPTEFRNQIVALARSGRSVESLAGEFLHKETLILPKSCRYQRSKNSTTVAKVMSMLRVLQIDDDDDVRELTQLAVSLAGDIELEQAVSGHDCVATAQSYQPDLILLDYMMPGMSGADVVQRLQTDAAVKTIPIVFLTSRSTENDVEYMRNLGTADVWIKPFDPFELPELIRNLLSKKSLVGTGKN